MCWTRRIYKTISKYSKISDKSAKTTAENAAENMRKALSTILNDDFNDDIVIRPVLDLSDIQNGVGQMNSMLNNSIAATRSTSLANSIPTVLLPGIGA